MGRHLAAGARHSTGVGEERLAVAVAPDDRDVEAPAVELGAQPGDEVAVEVVDRAAPSAVEVVLADDAQPLWIDATSRSAMIRGKLAAPWSAGGGADRSTAADDTPAVEESD